MQSSQQIISLEPTPFAQNSISQLYRARYQNQKCFAKMFSKKIIMDYDLDEKLQFNY